MKQMSKEGWGALFGLILVVTGIYVVNLTIGSLNEMNDEYLKSKNNAIVALVSSELDVPKKEIVLKKKIMRMRKSKALNGIQLQLQKVFIN